MVKRTIPVRHYFLMDIDVVIRLLIVSDIVFIGAAGLLGPIFALFIEDFVVGGDAAVVGVATAIYLFTKSALQIPIATLIDRIRGERDDFLFLFSFTLLSAVLPLAYLIVHTPLQLYILQFIFGLAIAFTFPSFMALFTRHIDRTREATEWGVYFTLTDLSSAAMAAIGGLIAATIGFPSLIVAVAVLGTIGALLLWPVRYHLKLR